MPIEAHITDPLNGKVAGVGIDGRVKVGPPEFSTAFNAELTVDDIPVNLVPAKAGQRFIMTSIILTGNKNVSGTVDATVSIYQGTSSTTTFANRSEEIITIPVGKSAQTVIPGIFLGCEVATWINAVTSDDDVFVTILGYYVKVAT